MSLRYVMLLQRDVPKAARFYSEGLGLHLRVLTDRWAELDGGGTTIALKAADGCALGLCPFSRSQRGPWCPICPTSHLSIWQTLPVLMTCREAYCTTGYTPILSFTVDDLQQTLTKLIQLGATMDGPVQYPTQAKVSP